MRLAIVGDTHGNMSWMCNDVIPYVQKLEAAQSVIPGLTEEEADFVLWERTPFPMVSGRDDLLPFLVAERDRRAAGQP